MLETHGVRLPQAPHSRSRYTAASPAYSITRESRLERQPTCLARTGGLLPLYDGLALRDRIGAVSAVTRLLDRELRPVENRSRWLAWRIALQAVGVGIPTTAALSRANKDGVGGTLTHYTIRLVWHEMLRSRGDIALIALGVAVFAAGGIVLARPFVRRPIALFVVTPLAATLGFAVLGVIALLCAAVIALAESPGDVNWADLLNNVNWPSDGDHRNRRR